MPGKPEIQENLAVAASAAGASALRRVSLMRAAPPGRAFAAIATLTELSRRIEASLEAAAEAAKTGAEPGAEWAKSMALMEDLNARGESFGAEPQERPSYLRKSAEG